MVITIVALPHGWFAVYYNNLPVFYRSEQEAVDAVGCAGMSWQTVTTKRLATVPVS
jgi:hypothetical protein